MVRSSNTQSSSNSNLSSRNNNSEEPRNEANPTPPPSTPQRRVNPPSHHSYASDYKSPYSTRSPSLRRCKEEHPSEAFLLKAAKEEEKVRASTQRLLHQQLNKYVSLELFRIEATRLMTSDKISALVNASSLSFLLQSFRQRTVLRRGDRVRGDSKALS